MLVHIASFPRSGKNWIDNLITHSLGRLLSSYYPDEAHPDKNLIVEQDGERGPYVLWYENRADPNQWHQCLMNNIGQVLDPTLRRTLAKDPEVYLVASHELPYADYFEGEAVIHIVRHPAAVMWSFALFRVAKGQADTTDLKGVIEGSYWPGSWSDHTLAWARVAEKLGGRYLLIRYEDLATQTTEYVAKIASLTGLPVIRDPRTLPPFEYWHRADPRLYRQGKIDDWKAGLDSEARALIWALHGQAMSKVGYDKSSLMLDETRGPH